MPENRISKIPEFAEGSMSGEQEQEVKESPEETQDEVKETPEESSPEEQPTEESTEEESSEEDLSEDTTEEVEETPSDVSKLQAQKEQAYKELIGLTNQKAKLLQEVKSLRGDRRELREAELHKVEGQIRDELKDINPEDIPKVERIVKKKGFVTNEDVQKMIYNTVKQQQLDTFLNKYPEFKQENDSDDVHWNALQKELSYYKMPTDPYRVSEVLEKARKGIQPKSSERDTQPVKQRLKTAQKGSTQGIQRSSATSRLSSEEKEELRRGGWSEAEIIKMDKS